MSETTFERGKTITYPSIYPRLSFTPIFGHNGDFVWVEEVKATWAEQDDEFAFVRSTVHDQRVDRLKEENARLRSCLSDDAENARLLLGEVHELVALANRLGMMLHECYCVEKDKAFCDGKCPYGVDDETCEITKAMDVLEKYGRV